MPPAQSPHAALPEALVTQIRKLGERYGVGNVRVFGSFARGEAGPGSDVDLLVVMDTPKGEMDAILKVGDSLPDLPFRVDIVVRSRDVLERRKKLGDWFLREITKKGKVLYERTN